MARNDGPERMDMSPDHTADFEDRDWLTLVFVGCLPEELETIDQETVHIARRRAEVAMLLKPGTRTYEEIGEIVGRRKSTIARDVAAIRQSYHRLAADSYKDHLARELHFNTLLLKEAWDAWERSKMTAEDKAATQRATASGTLSTTSIKKRQRDGNPAFLNQLHLIWGTRLKLLGLIGEAAESKQQAVNDRPPEKLVIGVATSELV
jgi:hypothetical protein